MRILLPGQYDAVANVVCGHFDVSRKELKSKLRTVRISQARHVIWYLLKTITGTTLEAIASAEGRNHTSVLHGVVRACELITIDRDFATTVTLLESRCRLLLEPEKEAA